MNAAEIRNLMKRVHEGDVTALAKMAEHLRVTKAAFAEFDGMPLFQQAQIGIEMMRRRSTAK